MSIAGNQQLYRVGAGPKVSRDGWFEVALATTGDARRTGTLLRRLAAPVLLVLASIIFVAANAPAHQQMSLFDEYVYIDYLAKVPDEGVVHRGETTGPFARKYYSCEGVVKYGSDSPQNCATGDFSKDSDYPYGGKTSADIYTPLYFGATWLLAQPLTWLGFDLVEAGRLVGSLWLGSAAVLLFYAARRLGVSVWGALAVCVLLIASTAAWQSNTYISTDAPAMAAGAALLLAGLRYAQTGRGAWLLPALAVLAVAFKLQNFMAVVAVSGFLLLTPMKRREVPPAVSAQSEMPAPPSKKLALTVGGMLVLPLAFQVTWMMVRGAIAVSASPDQGVGQPLAITDLVAESLRFFGSMGQTFDIPRSATVGYALSLITSWMLIVGTVAPIAFHQRSDQRRSLALATTLTLLTAGPALAIATRLMEGYYFSIPIRYAISMLPLMLALTATVFDRRPGTRIALSVFALITFAASLTPYFPGDVW